MTRTPDGHDDADDIVVRLRRLKRSWTHPIWDEAAELIEALREDEANAYRAATEWQKCANEWKTACQGALKLVEIAKAHLAGLQNEEQTATE